MAALEAKIQQHERNVDQLKRALERSDQYIEDLESRLRKPENRRHEVQDMHGSSVAGADSLTQQQKISMMMRSLSDSERGSICSNPEAEYQNFDRNPRFMGMPPANGKEFQKAHSEGQNENFEGASSDFLPTTPSSAFRSLTLRSPGIREKKVAFKPVSHLRRLNFEEFPSPEKSGSAIGEKPFRSLDKLPKCLPSKTDMEACKSVLWDGWQRSESNEPGLSSESTVQGVTSASIEGDNSDSFQMSSEASMDAAYLDKISELDSMMLDGESSSSRGSQLSLVSSPPADLDSTIVPDPQSCPDILSSHPQRDHGDDHAAQKEATEASSEEHFTTLGSDSASGATVPGSTRGSSQTDELSFDLLFDSLEENKIGLGGSLSKGSQNDPCVNSSTSSSCVDKPTNTAKDRQALNISQPTKRKSHSPFNTSSPTKLSKLM